MNYERVFDELFPPLLRYCHRLTGDQDTAEDAAQEAFVRLYTHDVDGPDVAVRVWLFRAATNVIRDRYRVEENRRRLLEKHPVKPGALPDPERELERKDDVALVREALEGLNGRDREMLIMRHEGFSYKEIGDALDVKASSVGTLLARAQRRFQDAYEGVAPDGAGHAQERDD